MLFWCEGEVECVDCIVVEVEVIGWYFVVVLEVLC